MEKLINSLPLTQLIDKNKKTGEENFAGLSLYYSVSLGKWVCGYGRNGSNPLHKGIADDPVEAVAFFVELLNKK